MNNIRFPARQRAVAAAAWMAVWAVHAQAQSDAAPAGAATAPASNIVVITGNPLASSEVAAPYSILSGDKLVQRRGASLGDTLQGLPGVSSSYFGPNANRPVIRGQDGDRIRLLSNASASLDASSLSYDHAVPIDPLAVERIEVLRGPAALLYGGSAVGGVVNTIDNRIPRSALSGLTGAAEGRLGGAAGERGASALLETGGSGFALHADAFWRKTDDLRVPEFDRPLDGGGSERRTRVVNSASESKGGAVGGSMVWGNGFLGVSGDTYRNEYGVVVEDDITIRMKRDKFALMGEVRNLGGFVETVRGQAGYTDYRHQEIEGTGEIGTTFNNKGTDLRLEALHAVRALGAGQLRGVFGLQAESSRFDALGEEAFVPSTRTRQLGLFVLEQWSLGSDLQLSAGVRGERVRVHSAGDADPSAPQFGPALQRRFTPRSASVGGVFNLTPQWQLIANVAYTERAPTSYELYANGVHAATGTFERGDVGQAKERGRNLDAALQWKAGHDSVKVGAFSSRFSNYIALVRTGEPDFIDDEGNPFPVFAFQGVRARLHGIEVEAAKRLWDRDATLDIDGHVDLVRGDNLSSGEPLPRIVPLRATAGVNWQMGPWGARAEVTHARHQDRVPSDDTATPAWTLINLSAHYKFRLGDNTALAFVRLDNATDRLAYNAASISTVRALAPLAGRALMAGLRVVF
jgi:iron complex outermembrane receptor protein